MGDTLARLHQWSEAERFHQAALEVQPDHVATHVSYGTMLARNVSFHQSTDGVCVCVCVEHENFTINIFHFRIAEHPKLNYGLRELLNWLQTIPVYDITTVNIHTSITALIYYTRSV